MKSTFIVATHNIQNTPDLARVEVRRSARAVDLGKADLAGFQEIREPADVADLRNGLGPDWVLVKANTSTPIGVHNDKFRVVADKTILFHQASGRVPTPRRQATRATVKAKRHPGHPLIDFYNAHPINGAFNNNHLDTKQMRKALWAAGFDALQEAIRESDAKGRNIVIVGDMNRLDMPKFMARQEWIISGGIDKIAVIMQPGWKCHVDRKWEKNTPSDHDAKFAKLTIRKRR